jgi:hypothetical protein
MNDDTILQRRGFQILDAATRHLQKEHPDLLIPELVELLPEPDRTRGRIIIAATTPPGALFIERVHRQWWHASIEDAISAVIRSSSFDLDAILAEAGVAPDAVERPEAERYACRMLEALAHCPAQPVIKRTDKLQ